MKKQTIVLLIGFLAVCVISVISTLFIQNKYFPRIDDRSQEFKNRFDSLQFIINCNNDTIIELRETLESLSARLIQNSKDSVKIVKYYEKVLSNIVMYNRNTANCELSKRLIAADSAWQGHFNSVIRSSGVVNSVGLLQ